MDAADRNGTPNGGSVSGAVGTESDTEDRERSNRTGWERERESFESYRQKNSSGRGTVVAPTRTHSSSDALGNALMGVRGIGNFTDLFEDIVDDDEEFDITM